MKRIAHSLWVAMLCAGGWITPVAAELSGSPAPDFVLKAADGKNYRLSEYRGQVVLISFWASWCGECRNQIEELVGLYSLYAGGEFEMIGVSLDRERSAVVDAARSLDVNFPALHDAGGDVGEQYDVDDLPYTVLVDRDGTIRDEFFGYRKGEEQRYLERVRELLAE